MSRLCLSHHGDDHTGYGRMGLQLQAALEAAGVEIDADPMSSPASTVVWVKIPPQVHRWLGNQRPCIFTMYETTELPVQFRALSSFDTVIVPCAANVESFSKWHRNVKRVPLGVDDRWEFRYRPVDGPFTFLTSGHTKRKGTDVTVAAFQAAFPDNPDVRLVVKAPKTDDWLRRVDDDRISIVTGYLTADDELDLYGSSHCYVGLSRGEGFGMMPLQAIRSGLPTIISEGHGHDEFSYLAAATVPTTLVPADDYTLYGWAGDWWEPDLDAAVGAMRDMYDNYDRHLASVIARSDHVADSFTWEHTATALVDALGGYDTLGTVPPTTTIRRPDPLLVKFRVNRRVNATIGDYNVRFVPGEDYWHTINVRDVIDAAGFLATDPRDSEFRVADTDWAAA